MSDSHALKGKDDDQPPYIKREEGKSLTATKYIQSIITD